MDRSGPKLAEWTEVVRIGTKWTELDQMSWLEPNWTEGTKMDQSGLDGLNWTEVDPIGPKWTEVGVYNLYFYKLMKITHGSLSRNETEPISLALHTTLANGYKHSGEK